MVKCAVCGAVFDASLETCPVCGVGSDKFIPVVTEEVTFKKDTDEKFVIVGGGPAAYSAAKAVRERNATADITILSDEPYRPYNRPMLTKELISDVDENTFAIEGPEWYDENNITFTGGCHVERIDTEARQVITPEGSMPYDKLIYATGAFCFVPPIKGSDKAHVKTVRNIGDVHDIQRILKDNNVENVVCIGGGVMGLEGAWETALAGYDVTVLETAPGLLPRQLDDPASAMLETICNEEGVKVVTGAKITEITDDAVLLDDGRSFPAGLVIMSTGMRPYTDVAEKSGITVDRWVVADGQMRTNVPDVYAAGDCMMVYGAPQAFYAQAIECGRIAGANAAGDDLTYDALGASLVINAMNTGIFALGANGKDPDKVYRTVEFKDEQRKTYEKYYFRNNILEGCILIGDISKMLEMTDHIMNKDSYEEVFK